MIKEISLNGVTVKFSVKDKNEHIQKHWMSGGFYEAHSNGLLAYMYRNKEIYIGKDVLDIGACIGNHSVFFDKILNMKVVAFEPELNNYNHLLENLSLNSCSVHPINIALGDHKGTVSMEYQDKGNIGMFQVTEGSDVGIAPLDDYKLSPNVIKIDVEHYNLPLLRGAKETIKKATQVFIECESEDILNQTNEIMGEYGFTLQNLKLNHTPTYLWV